MFPSYTQDGFGSGNLLMNQAGGEDGRYHPSSRRPRCVITDIASTTFLGESCDVKSVRLEVRFWYPAGVNHEYYRINWIEPAQNLMLGVHQDADHSDLGPCHIQLNYEDTPVDRYEATFLDIHPRSVLDERLQQLPTALATIRRGDGKPSLPKWPV